MGEKNPYLSLVKVLYSGAVICSRRRPSHHLCCKMARASIRELDQGLSCLVLRDNLPSPSAN